MNQKSVVIHTASILPEKEAARRVLHALRGQTIEEFAREVMTAWNNLPEDEKQKWRQKEGKGG